MKVRHFSAYITEIKNRSLVPIATKDVILKPGEKLLLAIEDQDGNCNQVEIVEPEFERGVK